MSETCIGGWYEARSLKQNGRASDYGTLAEDSPAYSTRRHRRSPSEFALPGNLHPWRLGGGPGIRGRLESV